MQQSRAKDSKGSSTKGKHGNELLSAAFQNTARSARFDMIRLDSQHLPLQSVGQLLSSCPRRQLPSRAAP